jgi:GNAT superfamily N-acetyltransferase
MKQRVIGFDVARALAIFGMVVVKFKVAMNTETGSQFLISFVELFEGRTSGLFVILSGNTVDYIPVPLTRIVMTIKKAKIRDAEGIQSLILRAVEPESNTDFDKEGVKNFKETLELKAIKDRIINNDYLMLCFTKECKIVGMIAIYRREKLSQLFVDPTSRKLNIAKQLWSAANEICIAQGANGKYWVKSSTMAIPVYKSFGFRLDGPQQNRDGIVYYSMLLESSM